MLQAVGWECWAQLPVLGWPSSCSPLCPASSISVCIILCQTPFVAACPQLQAKQVLEIIRNLLCFALFLSPFVTYLYTASVFKQHGLGAFLLYSNLFEVLSLFFPCWNSYPDCAAQVPWCKPPWAVTISIFRSASNPFGQTDLIHANKILSSTAQLKPAHLMSLGWIITLASITVAKQKVYRVIYRELV